MSPRLYLTAEGLTAFSAHWPCLLLGELPEPMTLADAAHALGEQTVELLLPMELCSWVRTEPWPSRRHPGAQAIAFAVEEHLSEALEDLHLGVGARDSAGCYPVMVIGRQRFAALLALMDEVGINVGAVFVDADVLPGEQPLGVRWCGRWVLGAGLAARVALSDEGVSLLASALPDDLHWLDERQEAAHITGLFSAKAGHAIDLRTGAFARRRRRLPWRLAGLSMLLLVLLTGVGYESRVRFIQQQTQALAALNEQRFKAMYPDQPRVAALWTQLKALQTRTHEPRHTHIARLVSLVERVIGASDVDVQRVEFRQGEGWKVQLTASSFATLEQLRERGRQHGLPVRLDSASQQHQRVHATLVLEEGA
ncbi:type II secretion system protein GspL [Pseudomonas sp. SDO528_S397]